MDSPDQKLTRIGIFYDGNYFYHVSSYYNYVHERRSRISIEGLHNFIRHKVAESEGTEAKFCQIVDAHYFRGRLSAYEAQNRNALMNERVFDDVLMKEGIVTHYLPLRTKLDESKGVGISIRSEKGIDVWLALETLELAFYKKYNVIVLIACDSDYIPLVRKLNTLGIRVMVLGWDFKYTDDNGKDRTTVTSFDLLQEVTYPVVMHDLINNKVNKDDSLIRNMFVQREKSNPVLSSRGPAAEGDNSGTIKFLGEGFGFIIHPKYPNNLFFHWGDVDGNFNDLKPGDAVTFTPDRNEKGDCARDVRKL
jgi:cold shock CspA family protein/uncharacterized LabA/DUF88 family protein